MAKKRTIMHKSIYGLAVAEAKAFSIKKLVYPCFFMYNIIIYGDYRRI